MAADKLCVVCCVWCVVCLRGVSCAVRCVLCVLCVVCCYCVIWCCVLCFRVHVEDDIYRQRGLYRCVVVACMLCLVVYCLVLLACLALAWLVLLRRCDVIFPIELALAFATTAKTHCPRRLRGRTKLPFGQVQAAPAVQAWRGHAHRLLVGWWLRASAGCGGAGQGRGGAGRRGLRAKSVPTYFQNQQNPISETLCDKIMVFLAKTLIQICVKYKSSQTNWKHI